MARDPDSRESAHQGERNAIAEMRSRALEMWGQERVEEIEGSLERTALAVWRMTKLEFKPADSPAFSLSEFAGEDAALTPEDGPDDG